MTCGYQNSAGTDLDNIFAVTNSNAGALGFQCSNDQDLGNRYPSGSLGYSVGFQNSAGTDIGYLRCKTTTTSVTIPFVSQPFLLADLGAETLAMSTSLTATDLFYIEGYPTLVIGEGVETVVMATGSMTLPAQLCKSNSDNSGYIYGYKGTLYLYNGVITKNSWPFDNTYTYMATNCVFVYTK